MKILSIDTSCDETAAAVTEDTKILSNVIWSQASLHSKFGGVMPSLAQREHQEHIDWVVSRAMLVAKCQIQNIDAVAVTAGPGLAIALGVGISRAKELAMKYNKPLIAVNHLEGHLLSSLTQPRNYKSQITNYKKTNNSHVSFPTLGLVVSGGNTLLVEIGDIGKYKVLAETTDDALGEALDKAARMLGLGYPGGAVLEKFAKEGDPKNYSLPIPIIGHEDRMLFTYSGLKSAMYRLVESKKTNDKNLTKRQIVNLAACFQNAAFTHLIRVCAFTFHHLPFETHDLLVGGGVSANMELRKRLRKLCKKNNINIHFPYTKKLTGDNAAMIGIAAYYKCIRKETTKEIVKGENVEKVDREANAKIDMPFKWQYNPL
jgi:N6-L-threonylcarbamoyladenine synthase